MQHVEQFSRVFGQPVIGLDVAKLGGRPPVADNWPLAVFLAVAEPLRQHPLAGDLVSGEQRQTKTNEEPTQFQALPKIKCAHLDGRYLGQFACSNSPQLSERFERSAVEA